MPQENPSSVADYSNDKPRTDGLLKRSVAVGRKNLVDGIDTHKHINYTPDGKDVSRGNNIIRNRVRELRLSISIKRDDIRKRVDENHKNIGYQIGYWPPNIFSFFGHTIEKSTWIHNPCSYTGFSFMNRWFFLIFEHQFMF